MRRPSAARHEMLLQRRIKAARRRPRCVLPESSAPQSREEIEVQQKRVKFLGLYDDLPKEIRDALRESPFDLHIMRPASQLVVENVVKRIKAVKTVADAQAFLLDFGAMRVTRFVMSSASTTTSTLPSSGFGFWR